MVKLKSISVKRAHCSSLYLHCARRDRSPATPRVVRAVDPRPPCAWLIHSRALEASRTRPFLLPRASRAARAAPSLALRPFLAAPLESFAPRPPLPCSPPPPPHPVPVRSNPRPNRPLGRRGRHCRPRRSSASLVDLSSPAILRPNRARGELPREPLILPDLFPFRSWRRRCRNIAAPPLSPCRRRACSMGRAHAAPRHATACAGAACLR